MKGGEENKKGH